MQDSTTREKILKKIRKALIEKTINPYPDIDLDSNVYKVSSEPLEIAFAQEFTRVGGKFVFCENELDFIESIISLAQIKKWDSFLCWEPGLQKYLTECEFPFLADDSNLKDSLVGVTLCEALIARTGSILVSSRQIAGRRLFIYPHIHIVLAYATQLLPDNKEALNFIKAKYLDRIPSLISSITGPSRTSDIESTSIIGAHGPKEVYVFLIDDID